MNVGKILEGETLTPRQMGIICVVWLAIVIVTAVGLAFFARPYTAVLFAAPFVVHACWTLWQDRAAIRERLVAATLGDRVHPTLARQVTTALPGLGGVALTLAYNAAMTGSPTRFPYQAFAPLDGLGFGTRRLLGHQIQYTPELAVRANAQVVRAFFTEWFAGGILGTALAALGLFVVARREFDAREAALAGVAVSVVVGNVYFWGNYNILGNLSQADDGLIGALGPHYHYDLLLPTAAFAARGSITGADWLRRIARDRLAGTDLDARTVRIGFTLTLVVAAAATGLVSAGLLAEPITDNAERTEVYERAYEPFEDGPPENSVVFLPGPYGDWLNHPFQPLRNDPGYDGKAVYALETRPFEVADAFPNRHLYRYAHRGFWSPSTDSPEAARLTRVRDVRGERVTLHATAGIPRGAQGTTISLAAGDESAAYVATNVSDGLDVRVRLTPESVRLSGDVRPVRNATIRPRDAEEIRLTATVDRPGGSVFDYRIGLPVRSTSDEVRALSPRVERCRDVRTCGGSAAYIPERSPDGIFVRTNLSVAS
mgnify:CR=1 FL=1